MTTSKSPGAPAPSPTHAVDRPPVPTTRRSWLVTAYLALSTAVLAGFVLAGLLGWELRDGKADRAPGSARQSPGGYRAYHFWHTGYHGGK
jgi:hypothetical protein